jgi:prolyl 4-hydroxylase
MGGCRYTERGHYREHYDWLPDTVPSLKSSGNRLTSFFIYLLADCDGGTTIFPRVRRPGPSEWCTQLKCRHDNGQEVGWLEVKPKVGTAIFWYNLDRSGAVDEKTLHLGAPVFNGTKFGLNIWTRERSWRKPKL